MVKSRFRFWVFLILFVFLLVCLLCGLLLSLFIYYPSKTPIGIYFLFLGVLFLATWLFFGEIRTKAIVIQLEKTQFTYRRFLGFAPPKTLNFDEIDGFRISKLPSRGGEYEYLYLMKNGKKVAKISQYYHRNYEELKNFISAQTNDMGFEEFNYLKELREIFQ